MKTDIVFLLNQTFKGLFFSTFLFYCLSVHAQDAPSIQWVKCLGGSGGDNANSIQQTKDGGFIIAGSSDSNDGDVSGNHINIYGTYNSDDYWIVKLDAKGNLQWQKSLGGSGTDKANSVRQTKDGGYIVAGSSDSKDGDVTGNHGYDDYWVVKLDSIGNIKWQKSLGGSGFDEAYSAEQTTDGGFIIAGASTSVDGDISKHHGPWFRYDFWIVKLDSLGNKIEDKSLGGKNDDKAFDIKQTTDGGFIVVGFLTSDSVSGNNGYEDYLAVRLDALGKISWEKTLGGSLYDVASSVQQTTDGGFIIAGTSTSTDGDVKGNHGYSDYWVVKLDSNGNLKWSKALGGTGDEQANSVEQINDGGFIVAGWTDFSNGEVTGNHGGVDYWIVKLDSTGNLIWQKCLGGSGFDYAYSVEQTADDGFIVAGHTFSYDGEVSGNHTCNDINNSCSDFWIVKLSPEVETSFSNLTISNISFFPNPVQNKLIVNPGSTANEETIHVYDLEGKSINLPMIFQNSQIQVNTSSLSNGFYTLQIINNKTGQCEVGSFVKQ